MFRENQMECHHAINLFKSLGLKSDLSTQLPRPPPKIFGMLCFVYLFGVHLLIHHLNMASLFSSQVWMFDL